MTIINREVLAAAYKSFRAIFLEAGAAADKTWKDLVTLIPSGAESETYNWLASLGSMREWIGDRVIQGLKAFGWTITNKEWEKTIAVDRKEFLFDKLALVKPRIQDLAQEWNNHVWELVGGLLVNGFTTLCYDGQYFFDPDHPVGGVSVSNKTTDKLDATSLATAIAAIRLMKTDEGKSMRLGQVLTLIVGPLEEANAKTLLNAEQIDGTTNVMRGAAKLVVLPDIQDHAWFLGDFSKSVRPFIMQVVKEGEFVAMDDAKDENVFMRHEYLYGIDSIDNAGYSLWQLMYGSTGAGS